jgi:Tetratrico peptide repeat
MDAWEKRIADLWMAIDVGREREAVAVSLTALSRYLTRYNRSLARYARQLSADIP